jgi:predicted GH43/DUF377 family glycosyl hydrolase
MNWYIVNKILEPNKNIRWLYSWASASCVIYDNSSIYDLYITGRDNKGRGMIGKAKLNIKTSEVFSILSKPLLDFGAKGSFDENGITYPYVIKLDNLYYLYYTGWIQGVQVPWMNGLGLAISDDGKNFKRFSRAPIFHRNNNDFIGIGSVCVIYDDNIFKMWYTSFERWGGGGNFDHKHYYNIKYAESLNGYDWNPLQKICIDFKDSSEYAIAKPTVIKVKNKYLMWYSYRGNNYKIGFAVSENGINWIRRDEIVGISTSESGWDSEMVCYPYVFQHDNFYYMLYNGNGYGASGLGLARIKREEIDKIL